MSDGKLSYYESKCAHLQLFPLAFKVQPQAAQKIGIVNDCYILENQAFPLFHFGSLNHLYFAYPRISPKPSPTFSVFTEHSLHF